jgi:hypothetical protein
MTEKKIKIDVGNGRYITFRFVLENGEWVCRATAEFLHDITHNFGVKE